MISFLRGKVADANENYLVIDCNGVGYEMLATANAVYNFQTQTGEVVVPTYLAVQETGITLFGFADNNEKNLFLKLITVSGVGPKLAITVLSGMKVDSVCIAIATGDSASLATIKGLGKKTAEKIILELKGKMGDLSAISSGASLGGLGSQITSDMDDAAEALVGLGIIKAEALKIVQAVAKPDMKAEEIIRKSLAYMSK